jgi:hypothetical protein
VVTLLSLTSDSAQGCNRFHAREFKPKQVWELIGEQDELAAGVAQPRLGKRSSNLAIRHHVTDYHRLT